MLVDREIDPPGTDGLHLAEELVEAAPHVPVIVLSHRADRAADAEAAANGIADFLVVPGLSRDRLEHAIRYALTHQRTLQKLAESEQRHALALAGANDGLWDWDVATRHRLLLPALEEHARLPRPRGRRDPRRMARPRARRRPRAAHAGAGRLRARRRHRALRVRAPRAAPRRRATAITSPARSPSAPRDKKATRVVGSVTDVTDRREAEHRLQHDALHDALTGLPNRVLFVDRLDQAIRRAQRHHPECCSAVLFLDLDRFKIINDSLGHATGDELLKAVARRLEKVLRPNDTVARLSPATSSRCCWTTSATRARRP